MAVTEISPDLHTLCLRYAMPVGRGYGGDHLGAVAGNAFDFVLAAHHEAGDVLQEYQWNLALAAQLDEVRAFLRRFGKQDAVIGDDAYRHAVYVGESGNQRGAVAGLEFIEFRTVDDEMGRAQVGTPVTNAHSVCRLLIEKKKQH